MSIVRFEIIFDNPKATYICGQQVTGNVLIEFLKEKKFRAIDLKFLGEARVEWSETHDDDTITYRNKEVYIQNSINVVGGSNAEITLSQGTHKYPFALILPWNIPSSFENRTGHIRYFAKAYLRRPGRFDHTTKSAFTVLCPLDLNLEPGIFKPIRTKTDKKLFFGLAGSPIVLEVSLPFSGYVPGQTCQADFDLKNPTSNGVSLKARIIQVITFIAKGNVKKIERKTICKEHIDGVHSKRSMTSSVSFEIPVLPNSYLHNCDFIDISYTFEIKGSISGIHRNISASIPIVIGSIPLRSQFENLAQWEQHYCLPKDKVSEATQSKEEESQGTSSGTSTSPNPFFSYPDMPPPSYEECVADANDIRNGEDNEYVRGTMTFAPRYPVYSFKENKP